MVITRAQAAALGAHPRAVSELVRAGILVRTHPAVYAVAGAMGDPCVPIRAAIAAVAAGTRGLNGSGPAIGTAAVASHGTAAWLQDIVERPPPTIHLTAALPRGRRLSGVVVHRTNQPVRSILYRGIRCTPPVRTLIDLAASAPPSEIDRAVDRALASGLVRLEDIESGLAADGSGRRGVGYLRLRLFERGYVGGPTPSVLESDMGRLLRKMGLPVPKAEVHAGPDGRYRIDYAYGSRRVAIEVYGYTWHHSPEQLAGDVDRQRRLTLEGWTVLIYTWQDVQREGERVAAQIASALDLCPELG